jgi:ethanolamine ammonia-lyase large subunit
MLNYQSTSFHDVLAIRQTLGKRPAPEFEVWLQAMGLQNAEGLIRPDHLPERFQPLLSAA